MKTLPIQSTDGDAHTALVSGKKYDVYKLIHFSRETEVVTLPVERLLCGSLWEPCWSDEGGLPLAPGMLFRIYKEEGNWKVVGEKYPAYHDHIVKVLTADYSFPLLMYEDDVIDGMHRIVRALCDGMSELPVRILKELPEEARYQG